MGWLGRTEFLPICILLRYTMFRNKKRVLVNKTSKSKNRLKLHHLKTKDDCELKPHYLKQEVIGTSLSELRRLLATETLFSKNKSVLAIETLLTEHKKVFIIKT